MFQKLKLDLDFLIVQLFINKYFFIFLFFDNIFNFNPTYIIKAHHTQYTQHNC